MLNRNTHGRWNCGRRNPESPDGRREFEDHGSPLGRRAGQCDRISRSVSAAVCPSRACYDGIQKGFLAGQARSLASQVGAKGELCDKIVAKMIAEKKVSLEYAQELLNTLG